MDALPNLPRVPIIGLAKHQAHPSKLQSSQCLRLKVEGNETLPSQLLSSNAHTNPSLLALLPCLLCL
ncbi:hypothetical protein F2Q70_00039477 [Brassica cretica]|uniref:Uncharacterized protein n=1 Tax=Brassica cretica TaxID=69181 RepID=A0A8S9K384_BRACR|nr:hypothetical protein F2Q70_00039477 [Brassica cretica]